MPVAAIVRTRMRLAKLAVHESHTDREDRYIFCVLNLLHNLVQSEFAESVDPGRNQNDVFLSLDAIKPVQRVVERIEQVRFRETGNPYLIQSPKHGLLVLREVHYDMGLHVVVLHCDPVILLQRVGESIRRP